MSVPENGGVVPAAVAGEEDALLQSNESRSCDPADAIVRYSPDHDVKSEEINHKELPWLLEYYISCLVHLAVFGILGVLSRYSLQKLFGPGVFGVTSDRSILYLDLPSNIVGSFLMGWLGIVFKADISRVSDQLAMGLSTGYLGSLTTFSGWTQKMLDLSVKGEWILVVLGFLVGLLLVDISIIFGVKTALGFKRYLEKKILLQSSELPQHSQSNRNVKNCRSLLTLTAAMLLMFGFSGALEGIEFHRGGSGAQLWLGCIVGPLGVWIRWLLARLNGRGLGKSGMLEWLPFGTLIANVSAACFMSALAMLKKAVKTKTCDTVASGIQFGLLGCLSTVSTFIAEFDEMRQSAHPWRAYAYASVTILVSFSLGTLIYSEPVWTKGYDWRVKSTTSVWSFE